MFDPASVPAPTPSPTPSPFPLADPSPAPFVDDWCHAGVAKSFVGWAKVDTLGINLKPGWDPEEYVYAMVTRDVVPIGDATIRSEDGWHDDATYPGHKVRWWGRYVCMAQDLGLLTGATVIGTTYLGPADGWSAVRRGRSVVTAADRFRRARSRAG